MTGGGVAKLWVYLGVKTCEVFLCLVVIVGVRVYYVDFFVGFFCFTSLVSFTGSYTEDEPKLSFTPGLTTVQQGITLRESTCYKSFLRT